MTVVNGDLIPVKKTKSNILVEERTQTVVEGDLVKVVKSKSITGVRGRTFISEGGLVKVNTSPSGRYVEGYGQYMGDFAYGYRVDLWCEIGSEVEIAFYQRNEGNFYELDRHNFIFACNNSQSWNTFVVWITPNQSWDNKYRIKLITEDCQETSEESHIFIGGNAQKVWKLQRSDLSKITESEDYGASIRTLGIDKNYIYAAGTWETQKVYKLNISNLEKIMESSAYGGSIVALTEDADYVYIGGWTTQTVWKLQKSDLIKVAESADYGGVITALDEDGDYIFVGGSLWRTVKKLYKGNFSQVTESGIFSDTIYSISHDASYIYAGAGSILYKLDKTSLGTVSQYNYGGTIRGIDVDDDYVYIAGYTIRKVHKLQKSDLSKLVESENYGASIETLIADNSYVYIAGDANVVWKLRKSDLQIEAESESYGIGSDGWIHTLALYKYDEIKHWKFDNVYWRDRNHSWNLLPNGDFETGKIVPWQYQIATGGGNVSVVDIGSPQNYVCEVESDYPFGVEGTFVFQDFPPEYYTICSIVGTHAFYCYYGQDTLGYTCNISGIPAWLGETNIEMDWSDYRGGLIDLDLWVTLNGTEIFRFAVGYQTWYYHNISFLGHNGDVIKIWGRPTEFGAGAITIKDLTIKMLY